ncbi:DUF2938 domain-containing protein [Burkholderia singularis]|uniref:Permeases of the major facilitator superfamily n=1 Tax=Burkholderia singularis TaxID=1503053 RepID=A0A238H5Q4_9BURK|nr:Permeases of the major facilitator superfamily [Burkholderia singularis]
MGALADIAAYSAGALLIGTGATAATDVWAIVRRRWFGVVPLDYGLVGRWLAHVARGRFFHDAIALSPRVRCERAIGWLAHYLIGIGFAAVLLAGWGLGWVCRPTLAPALIVGIGSIAAPFFVMQPGMGAGVAASRTPRPALARLHSLMTHGVLGVGFYLTGCAISATHVLEWRQVC